MWLKYPDISRDIEARTESIINKWKAQVEIFHQMNLENSTSAGDTISSNTDNGADVSFFDLIENNVIEDRSSINKENNSTSITTNITTSSNGSSSNDLLWIQIEDFIELFNRIYIVTDLSMNPEYSISYKRFLGRWKIGIYIYLYIYFLYIIYVCIYLQSNMYNHNIFITYLTL